MAVVRAAARVDLAEVRGAMAVPAAPEVQEVPEGIAEAPAGPGRDPLWAAAGAWATGRLRPEEEAAAAACSRFWASRPRWRQPCSFGCSEPVRAKARTVKRDILNGE